MLSVYLKKKDDECINNEDFNGTVFGIFSCPLPGFNDTAKFCCGSLENQTQFCCDYYDKFNITESKDEGYILLSFDLKAFRSSKIMAK